jgi:hypothetical protein
MTLHFSGPWAGLLDAVKSLYNNGLRSPDDADALEEALTSLGWLHGFTGGHAEAAGRLRQIFYAASTLGSSVTCKHLTHDDGR